MYVVTIKAYTNVHSHDSAYELQALVEEVLRDNGQEHVLTDVTVERAV